MKAEDASNNMKSFKKYKLLFFTFCFAALTVNSQDKSNKGKEFWLGYGHNVLFTQDPPYNTQTLVLYLSAEQAASVTVSVNNTGWSQAVNIPANTVDFSITIPKTGADDARLMNEGLSTKGIHIVSDVPIVAYAHQYGLLSSGATMLMPVETFGYTYYSVNYTQVSNYVDSYSWFYVVASENNTRVEITPSDSTQGGWLPTQTYTVNLNKGEIYNVFGRRTSNLTSKDMTGSKIVSVAGGDGQCHPVGVFSGSSRITICSGNGGEFMQQQIFPANAWGTKYLTYHNINNTAGNIATPFLNFYRVAVRNPGTIVKRNGVVIPQASLVNNFYYEITSTSGDIIEADQPILVAQYTGSSNECTGANTNPLGDPEMIFLSPIEQGVKKAIFYNTRNQSITLNFVNIIVPVGGLNSLLVDGTPISPSEYIIHPNSSNYAVVARRLTGAGAQHSVSCDSTFIATNYGSGTLESYAYNVGTLVNNLNAYTEIKNTYNSNGRVDTFTCPKTPLRLFVNIAYKAASIHWKLSQANGINPGVDSVISNPIPVDSSYINGRRYYTYSLQQDFSFATTGTYYVPVSYSAPDIDACNQTESTNIKIVVKAGPIADFNSANPVCFKDNINLTGTPNAAGFTLTNYLWSFDDNTIANTVNTIKAFNTSGPQNVRYRVFADNGCAGDTTKTITVLDAPVARFGVNQPSCSRDSVLFTDTSSISQGTVVNWSWDFGDGTKVNYNNNTHITHRYASAGTYIVSLVVSSDKGCKSDTTKRSITVLPSPIANFSSSGNVCLGDSIMFTDNSSTIVGTITGWQWNFGDGNTITRSSNASFYHPYASAGSYVTSLVVYASNGCSSDTFRVPVAVSNHPVASISVDGKPCVDSIFRFTSSITVNAAVPATWYWDFGDQQTINSNSTNIASHAYPSVSNNIIVKHAVSVGVGCISDTAVYIIPAIHANPVASFALIGDTLCEKKPLKFTAQANAAITSWNWDFGDGATGNNAPPFSRAFKSAGNYKVQLIAKTAVGCGSAPFTQSVVINQVPKIEAGPDKIVNLGASTRIDAVIPNPSGYNFSWLPAIYLDNPGILNPVSTPLNTQRYTITAIDKNSFCIGIDSMTVHLFTQLYVPNAFTPNEDGKNDVWEIPGLAMYPEAIVAVYNRGGQKVYESKGIYKPWDGYFNGIPQSNDAYVYMIRLSQKKDDIVKGTVMILR